VGQALYRKYRSKKLDDIVGQKPIVTALANALKNGQISHAYLFTGPRGVGKTSIARILAHEINNIPYINDEMPIDIIEIDAASNRRIDEIRDLRDKVRIAPVSAKFKVYIIDEVHMLTREAFNALLKTLEEPPAHVIFILATTEAHKLPETIISRTQRYNFKLASPEEVINHLRKIATQEKITIDDASLEMIATHSGGSMRDALSLLDQIRHSASNIDVSLVRQNFGLPPADLILKLLDAIKSREYRLIVSQLQQARDDSTSATLIAEQLIQKIREAMMAQKPFLPLKNSVELVQSLLEVETSNRPDVQLEIVLISAQQNLSENKKSIISEAHFQDIEPPLTISAIPKKLKILSTDKTATISQKAEATQIELSAEVWSKALAKIRQSHNTIYGILRMAEPDFDQIKNNLFILKFNFPFHQKRINETRNKQVIISTLASLGVTGYKLSCELSPKDQPAIRPIKNDPPPEQANNPIEQIRNVFGSAEVLE